MSLYMSEHVTKHIYLNENGREFAPESTKGRKASHLSNVPFTLN